jgi:hypothetical protein
MTASSVLIVNYNAGAALGECLAALADSDAGDWPVLLVDNASRDGSATDAVQHFPATELLERDTNNGFAAAVNDGLRVLRERGAERVLILNPDTVVAAGFAAPLSAALTAGAGLAGPKLVLPGQPRRLWCAGGAVTFGLNLSTLRGHRQIDQGQFDRAEDVSFLPGTAWLLPRATLDAVGLLDERFFCYVEDVDFCLRIRAAGLRIRYEPASEVVHIGSLTSGGGYTPLRKYLNALGSVHLLRKHGSAARWARFLACDVATVPLALLYGALRRRPAAAWWKIVGLIDGFRGRGFEASRRIRLLPAERGA